MARFENRKWVIITLSDYNSEQLNSMIDVSLQANANSLRKTLDGTKTILKWDGDTPSCFNGMTTYNHSQILTILEGSDWKESE